LNYPGLTLFLYMQSCFDKSDFVPVNIVMVNICGFAWQTGTQHMGSTVMKTLPSSMISIAKAGQMVGTAGKHTIVIAAPKSAAGGKLTTTSSMQKLSTGQGGTQFIVVTTRPSGSASTVGGSTITSLTSGMFH